MGVRSARARLALLGASPRSLLPLLAPTLLALAIDVVLRGRDFWVFEPHGKAIYFSSLLVSAGFWVLPLVVASRWFNARRGPRELVASLSLFLLFGACVLPVMACGYVGEILYFRVFGAYAGRDTLRLGALLRGGYVPWFLAWASKADGVLMLGVGACMTFVLYRRVRQVAPRLAGPFPLLPVVTFLGALFCFWTDNVDSRFLQAATPDTCFLNGAFHALRAATTGVGRVREGVTLRDPAPLPPFVSERPQSTNVLLIVTESIRADVLCSDPPPRCQARFLDAADVAADRISLGKLTSQTPNTFSASMVLWTGLTPNADFSDAHRAPLLWEIARAAHYRTAYISSQNAKYEDFGVYVHTAGIDVREMSTELGGMAHEQLGAPDERATSEMLRFLHETSASTPYFAVLHLSNTHHPYRVDPSLQPFAPHADDPSPGVDAYFNHYRNSVLMQERLVADFIREVRELPMWDSTAIVFVSDHGEQFGEHGSTHHNHTLFDSDLRIAGWLVAGPRAVTAEQRAALETFSDVRTFSQDVNATVVDLLGAGEARATFPFHELVRGRSLLRPRDAAHDPTVLLGTATGVWEPNDPVFGVMRRERIAIGSEKSPWTCYDMAHDPREREPKPATSCPDLVRVARASFPSTIGAPR